MFYPLKLFWVDPRQPAVLGDFETLMRFVDQSCVLSRVVVRFTFCWVSVGLFLVISFHSSLLLARFATGRGWILPCWCHVCPCPPATPLRLLTYLFSGLFGSNPGITYLDVSSRFCEYKRW